MRSVLALDIGGTKLAAGVVTPDGRAHGVSVQPTDRDRGPEPVIADLFALGRRALESAAAEGVDAPEAVGISCGGPLNAATGVLVNPLHLPGWIDIPIVDLAHAEFGLPAALENDATLAALAEYRHGAGDHARVDMTSQELFQGCAHGDDSVMGTCPRRKRGVAGRRPGCGGGSRDTGTDLRHL